MLNNNRFFLKILFAYGLVIVLGIGLTANLLTSRMMNVLAETQSKYENEVLKRLEAETAEMFRSMDQIFVQLYMPTLDGYTIVDLLIPDKLPDMTQEEKAKRLMTHLQNTSNAHSFITDMLLADYDRRQVYFYSNKAYREIETSEEFFGDALFETFRSGTNRTLLTEGYTPAFIRNHSGLPEPVFTAYLNLYDGIYFRDDKKVGVAAINLSPEVFRKSIQFEQENLKGTLYVADSETGEVLFASKGELPAEGMPAGGEDSIRTVIDSSDTGLTFANVVSKTELYGELETIKRYSTNIMIISIVLAASINLVLSRMFVSRIKKLVRHTRLIEKGIFNVPIKVEADDEIGRLEASFNSMSQRLDHYIRDVYLAEIKTKTAELKSLQAQINPHFIFNTLESIRMNALIHKDEQTANMVHLLGNLFRWNLDRSKLFVPLEDELLYVERYMELQLIRYKQRFAFRLEMERGLESCGVPKMMLQPIIENAIYHGVSSITDGHILVNAYKEHQYLKIAIEDDGLGMSEERLQTMRSNLSRQSENVHNIGLSNVHQRIVLLFGSEYGIGIESREGQGTKVTITLPAQSIKELEMDVQGHHRG